MYKVIMISSSDINKEAEVKTAKGNTTEVVKSVGDSFAQWLKATTPDEVKKNNPKWVLD